MPPIRHPWTPAAITVNPSQVQNNPQLQSASANAYFQQLASPHNAIFSSAISNPALSSPLNNNTMPPKRQLKPALSNAQQSQAASSAAQQLQHDFQKQAQQQQQQSTQQQLQQHHTQQQTRQPVGKTQNQAQSYAAGIESTISLGELLPGVHQHANAAPGSNYQLPQFHHHGHAGYQPGSSIDNTATSGQLQSSAPPPPQQQQNQQGQAPMMGTAPVTGCKRKDAENEADKTQVTSGGQNQASTSANTTATPAPKRRRSTKGATAAPASTVATEGTEGVKPKARTNKPWTPQEEQRLKQMRDAGNSWGEIAKTFPTRTEGSVKKHWYKDMHYAEFGEDESAALLAAIKEYDANKWKVVGQKVGKPAKACEAYAKEHFQGKI